MSVMTNTTNTPEPNPIHNDSTPIVDLVIEDLRERAEMGKAKYGTYLKSNNGRDAYVDEYQEMMDALMYHRQRIEERKRVNGYAHTLQEFCALHHIEVGEDGRLDLAVIKYAESEGEYRNHVIAADKRLRAYLTHNDITTLNMSLWDLVSAVIGHTEAVSSELRILKKAVSQIFNIITGDKS